MSAAEKARPVAKLRTPGEIAAVVPLLLGFVPTESLVVLSLRGERRRLGLTVRLDLPPDWAAPQDLLGGETAARIRADGGEAAAAVVFTDRAGVYPYRRVIDDLLRALEAADIPVLEALLVRADRWSSYTCTGPCCPPEGLPMPTDEEAGGLRLVAVERVMSGRQVLASRAALSASIATVAPQGVDVLRVALNSDADEWLAELERRGRPAARQHAQAAWREAVAGAADPRWQPADRAAGRLLVTLADVLVRDAVIGAAVDHADAVTRLLELLCRRSVPPYDAPVCTTLAWVSYLDGGGALANVALDRALADDPDYSAALLLGQAISQGVAPERLRRAVSLISLDGKRARRQRRGVGRGRR